MFNSILSMFCFLLVIRFREKLGEFTYLIAILLIGAMLLANIHDMYFYNQQHQEVEK